MDAYERKNYFFLRNCNFPYKKAVHRHQPEVMKPKLFPPRYYNIIYSVKRRVYKGIKTAIRSGH